MERFNRFSHLLSYSDFRDGKVFIETYAEHAYASLKHWKIIKKRISRGLARVLDQPATSVEKAVSLVVLFHDAGKLTTVYQHYLNEKKVGRRIIVGFNHEVASIPVISKIAESMKFEKELSQIIQGGVLFHHEALRQHELRLKIESLISPICNKYRSGIVDFARSADELCKELVNSEFGINPVFEAKFDIKELRDQLIDLFLTCSPENDVELHRIRLRVSAVQQILTVCDNRGAQEHRPKEDYPFLREILEGGWRE